MIRLPHHTAQGFTFLPFSQAKNKKGKHDKKSRSTVVLCTFSDITRVLDYRPLHQVGVFFIYNTNGLDYNKSCNNKERIRKVKNSNHKPAESSRRIEVIVEKRLRWIPGKFPADDGTVFDVQRVVFKGVEDGKTYFLNLDKKLPDNVALWEPYLAIGNVLEVGILATDENVKNDNVINKKDSFKVVRNINDNQQELV